MDSYLSELDNMPRDSTAFSRYSSAYVPIANLYDPTSEPPRKSSRRSGQDSPSPQIRGSLKGKGPATPVGLAVPRVRAHHIHPRSRMSALLQSVKRLRNEA